MRQPWPSNKISRQTGAMLIGILLWACGTQPGAQASVWRELRATPTCDTYQPMTDVQLNQAEHLFEQVIRGTSPRQEQFASDWKILGYELIEISASGAGWVGLREAESPCRGNGVYLLNMNNPGPLVIQAPHAYHDLYTGTITAGMMRDGVAILAWNSAKRDAKSKRPGAHADLARQSDSLFVALTRAMIKSAPDGRLVQIHGFNNQRRRTEAGATAAVILSSGTRWGTRSVDFISRCLQSIIAGPILIYPTEVTELGATTNFHGQALRRHGHEGFVHIEINRPTRERLKSDSSLLTRFSACLGNETK